MFKETIASQRSDSPVSNIWLLYIWLLSLQEDHYSLPKCSSTSRFVPLPEGTGDFACELFLEEDFISGTPTQNLALRVSEASV